MKSFSYEVDLVNPKTSEESAVTVSITELQRARAKRSPDWMGAVMDFARPLMPSGFMPIGGRVREVSQNG
jgi:hypothetical protein